MSIVDYLTTNAVLIVGASVAVGVLYIIISLTPLGNKPRTFQIMMVFQIALFPIWIINAAWWFFFHLVFALLYLLVTYLVDITSFRGGE